MQASIDTPTNTAVMVADKLTIAGSAGSVLGWLTSSEAGVVIGILIGVTGLLINWYYKHKADKRAEATHKAVMDRAAHGLPLHDIKLEADE
jgi:hypothetical protein